VVGKTLIPPSPPLTKGGRNRDASIAASPPFPKGGAGGIQALTQPAALNEYDHRLKPLARNLRSHLTDAEQKLWHHLRRDQLGVRFYRQRPFGQYILDFYAPKARLVVELDGSQHQDDPIVRTKDELRDAWLSAQGLKVLRFDDRQVLTETWSVMEVIFEEVGAACAGEIPPHPPLQRGETPDTPAEGSLPFAKPPYGDKGGQEGFDDVRQSDPTQD